MADAAMAAAGIVAAQDVAAHTTIAACSTVTLAYYGDDFTGSTDTLATAVQAGWRAALFMRVPTAQDLAAFGPLDCIGIAGTARAQSPAQMDDTLPAIFRGLAATGAPFIQYKTCSTFDSAPHIGNIAHAMAIARQVLGARPALIVGGQPSLGRYCAFATLYARAGHDAAVYRIDRHPTMSRHPVTPMLEPDLRRHFAALGTPGIVSFDTVQLDHANDEARCAALDTMLAASPTAVLFDAMTPQHLARIGALLRHRAQAAGGQQLLVGPTGVLQALTTSKDAARNAASNAAGVASASSSLPARPIASERLANARAVSAPTPAEVGQTFIISGSRSPITAAQIDAAEAAGFVSLSIDAQAMVSQAVWYVDVLADTIAQSLAAGLSVIAHSTLSDGSRSKHPEFTEALARGCGQLMRQVLARHSLQRVGFAGGDTSSIAVASWHIQALTYSFSLSPGVAVCRIHAPDSPLDGVELMLKGGQMGPPDVFTALLGGARPLA
ncbi:four-carbon acid sugar kinase family protein [Alcaligenaceae bacterium A4P071]|nr:four-carbon acid sugar kinase family protein [Alcaligenaceae bacterium A4P071]